MWEDKDGNFLLWRGDKKNIDPPPRGYEQLTNRPIIAKPKMKRCTKREGIKKIDPSCNCTSITFYCHLLEKDIVPRDCVFCKINKP